MCPGLRKCCHRVALFVFCRGALGFHPSKTSFCIHFLAGDSLSHINAAKLEFSLHVVQLEVWISHGKPFSSRSEPQAYNNIT
jgi:hypothetical protein